MAGIPFEIVPGVTAVCAAAASAGQSLTDRGQIDTLVLTTGHREEGHVVPKPIDDIRPGTCVALYMAVGSASKIVDRLNVKHPQVSFEVQVVAKAQRKGQTMLSCTLEDLPDMLSAHGICGEAMLFVRWPRSAARAQQNAVPLSAVS